MSGTKSNVVPLSTTPPPMPQGMPSPMWWGGGPPGCAPPGGGLAECYWQVQAATAFISAIMIDAINNNPAVTTAIIDAIVKSGSNLPLIGVTNGADAQAGQVGEWMSLTQTVAYGTANQTQPVTLGTLPPGDWDIWAVGTPGGGINGASFVLNPLPAGFTGNLDTVFGITAGGAEYVTMASNAERALTSVPSLINFTVNTNITGTGTAGNFGLYFKARRRR